MCKHAKSSRSGGGVYIHLRMYVISVGELRRRVPARPRDNGRAPQEQQYMVRRTKEEALETRNRILDAAERIFEKRGVSRTSLQDIAEAAGVTRGAIYWHFKGKDELFAAMMERATM